MSTSVALSWIRDIVCHQWGLSEEFCDNIEEDDIEEARVKIDRGQFRRPHPIEAVDEDVCDNKLDIEITTDVQGEYLKMNLRETLTGESVMTRKYLVQYYKNYHSVCKYHSFSSLTLSLMLGCLLTHSFPSFSLSLSLSGLKDNTCYDFTFLDPYGDGMCKGTQNGTIALQLNGETEFVPDPCGFDYWLSHTICTGSATNAPTDTPTTDTPSNAPTDTPTTDAPTNAPTNAPTDAPTNAPTNAPTDAPTNLPTSAPTDAPDSKACVDDAAFYLRKNQPHKNCAWVANKKEKRCKKKNDSGTVESFCPSICNPRCTCKNKKGKITVKGENKKLTCKQIEKKDLCESGVTENDEKVSYLCASACDTCYN